MKLREAWRVSRTIYREVSFQSIFSLRSGGIVPQKANTDIRRLIKNAELNTLISKILMSVFIAIFGLMMFFAARSDSSYLGISQELATAGAVSAFLGVLLFLIVIMGLQVATSFFSSKITDIIAPLALSRLDISIIDFLCFMRIFDLPLVIALIGFPTIYIVFTGSVLGGLAGLVSVFVTEVFALVLTISLAKFFYARVASGGGRSKWKTLLRLALMLMWVLPSFGAYIAINFSPQMVQFFASLAQTSIALSQLLVVIYPFSFGFLVSSATFADKFSFSSLSIAVVASSIYVAFAAYGLKWVARTIGSIGAQGSIGVREKVEDTFIRPQIPWLGILRKDLRIASRVPSYASIFLLPAVQTVVLAVSFSSFSETGLSQVLGILSGMSFMTFLLPPALFSMEGLASAYTRSLPMRKRTLIFSKTTLSTLTYVFSLVVILAVSVFLQRDASLILTYGLVHMLAVAAANMLEIVLLTRKFWKEGFAIGNIYAKLSTYIAILIPGGIMIFTPIFAAVVAYVVAQNLVLPIFLAIALLEFILMATFALSWK